MKNVDVFSNTLFFQNQNKLTTSPNYRKIKFQYNPKKAEAPLYAAFIYFFLSATLYRLFGQTWQNNFIYGARGRIEIPTLKLADMIDDVLVW